MGAKGQVVKTGNWGWGGGKVRELGGGKGKGGEWGEREVQRVDSSHLIEW